MKKTVINVILTLNTFLWILLSAVNYVGIMQQLEEDVMRIFLWSIFAVMMYGLVIYSISLLLSRIYLLYYYRDNKDKYMDSSALTKQMLFLTGTIVYLYGACLYNANFLGLLPLLLFFGKKLTTLGRLYIYDNDNLYLFDDNVKECLVKGINQPDKKLLIQVKTIGEPIQKEIPYPSATDESKFLEGYAEFDLGQKEVA